MFGTCCLFSSLTRKNHAKVEATSSLRVLIVCYSLSRETVLKWSRPFEILRILLPEPALLTNRQRFVGDARQKTRDRSNIADPPATPDNFAAFCWRSTRTKSSQKAN